MPYGIQIVAVFVIIRIICFYGINFCLQVLFQLGKCQICRIHLRRDAHIAPCQRGTHAVRKHRPAGRYGGHNHNQKHRKGSYRLFLHFRVFFQKLPVTEIDLFLKLLFLQLRHFLTPPLQPVFMVPLHKAVRIFGFLLTFVCALHACVFLFHFGNLAMCIIGKL